MTIPLRPYQVEGVEAVRARIRAGKRRIVFVLPTGGGKTVIASALVDGALARSKRVLFVAHRRELIKQCFAKLLRNGVAPAAVGIIMAGTPSKLVDAIAPPPATLRDSEIWELYGRRRPTAPVQVASIDTLRTKTPPAADLVIVDEAHRALAKSYRDLAAVYPNATHLGLTATPYRADGRGLGDAYEDLVVIASPRKLIELGFLVAPRVWTVPSSSLPDLSAIRMKGNDYDPEQLERAVDRRELVGDIVAHWQRHAAGVRTVAFATSVAHSKHIAERFVEAGIAAEHLDGTTPTEQRDAILARLERGETVVVSNCGVLCEGWDQPSVKCAILARPTTSTGLYLQQAGRILRPCEGREAIILDHAGCALEHGLPQDDRDFSLDPPRRRRRGAEALPPTKTCPVCFAVVPIAVRECPPPCGFEFPAPEQEPDQKDGQLVEVDAAALAEKRARWDAIVELWRRINERRESPHPPEWCRRSYFRKHGEKPPPGCKLPKAPPRPQRPSAARPMPPAPAEVLPAWALPREEPPIRESVPIFRSGSGVVSTPDFPQRIRGGFNPGFSAADPGWFQPRRESVPPEKRTPAIEGSSSGRDVPAYSGLTVEYVL